MSEGADCRRALGYRQYDGGGRTSEMNADREMEDALLDDDWTLAEELEASSKPVMSCVEQKKRELEQKVC